MTSNELTKIERAGKLLAEVAGDLTAVTTHSTNYDLTLEVGYTVTMLTHIQSSLQEIAEAYPTKEA